MVDLIGVGNLNTDLIVHVEESFLESAGLKKGDDHGKSKHFLVERLLKEHKRIISFGGCVANTIVGAHELGLDCVLSGILGDDGLGEFYRQDIETKGLKHKISTKKGKCAKIFTLITPDKERTFADNLGVADRYSRAGLPYESITENCVFYTSIFTMEGTGRQAIVDLIKYMKKQGGRNALDLGSPRAVNKHKDFLNSLLEKEIDMVFCNREEAETFAQMNTDGSLDYLGELCEIAVVTLEEEGALIKYQGKTYRIPGYPAKEVDKTGAGDAFRAGFFYGMIRTKDIEKAGRMGCYYSSKVVEHVGARLGEKIKDLEDLEKKI